LASVCALRAALHGVHLLVGLTLRGRHEWRTGSLEAGIQNSGNETKKETSMLIFATTVGDGLIVFFFFPFSLQRVPTDWPPGLVPWTRLLRAGGQSLASCRRPAFRLFADKIPKEAICPRVSKTGTPALMGWIRRWQQGVTRASSGPGSAKPQPCVGPLAVDPRTAGSNEPASY
jgi:hypothetical protein